MEIIAYHKREGTFYQLYSCIINKHMVTKDGEPNAVYNFFLIESTKKRIFKSYKNKYETRISMGWLHVSWGLRYVF